MLLDSSLNDLQTYANSTHLEDLLMPRELVRKPGLIQGVAGPVATGQDAHIHVNGLPQPLLHRALQPQTETVSSCCLKCSS